MFRAFHGGRSATAPNGKEVGAVRTFAQSMRVLLRDEKFTHVGCAFDHVIESFRNELFAGYKTSEGITRAFWYQLHLAEEVAAALGMQVWPMIDYEADDALATAAVTLAKHSQVEQVMIASPDKDLYQVVDGRKIVVWDRMRGLIYGPSEVEEKLGVSPHAVPDYLALVGDAADGIPGIPGFGAKTSAALLAAFGSIEKVPQAKSAWPALRGLERLHWMFFEHREELLLYKDLATLRRNVKISCGPRATRWKGVYTEELKKVAQRIGMPSLTSGWTTEL